MAYLKVSKGTSKKKVKPGLKGITSIKLSPSFATASRTITTRKPPPKPKPKFNPATSKAPIAQHFRAIVKQKALRDALHANDSLTDQKYLRDYPPIVKEQLNFKLGQKDRIFDRSSRGTKYIGTGRPAPRAASGVAEGVSTPITPDKRSVIENVKDPTGANDPQYGFKLVSKFLAQQRDLAQRTDAFTRSPNRPPGIKPTNQTATFDRNLRKDPYFTHLMNRKGSDGQEGTYNVATVSAMGIPVGGKAAEKYIRDMGDIVAGGFTPPGTVPGLVLGADSAEQIAQLKAQVKRKGFSQEEINRMNFGQLAGAARGPDKDTWLYGNHFGSRALGTTLYSALPDLGRGLLGFPMGFASIAAAGVKDIKYNASNIRHGRLPKFRGATGTFTPNLEHEVAEGIKGTAQFGKELALHPIKTFTHNPATTFLAAWGALRGGVGIASLHPRFAPGRRGVAVAEAQNIGQATRNVRTQVPPGPIMVPGRDPMPAPPLYTAPRQIEAHMGQAVEHGQARVKPLHHEAEPVPPKLLKPGPGMNDAEVRASQKAHDAWKQQVEEHRAAQAQRLLSDPTKRQEELDKLGTERTHHREEAERIRKERDSMVNTGEIKNKIAALEEQYGQAVLRLEQKPRSRPRQLRVKELREDIETHRELLTDETTRRKELTYKLRWHNSWGDYLDHHISLAHIHAGIPHPDAGLRLKQVNARLKQGTRKGTTESDIAALEREREVLTQQSHDESLAAFKEATNPSDDWFDAHSEGKQSSPIEHVMDVLKNTWREQAQRDHGHDSQQAHDDMQDILEAAQSELDGNAEHLPPHIQSQVDAAIKDAEELFGEELNVIDEYVHPPLIPKMQEFMRRVQARVIEDHKAAKKGHDERDTVNEAEWAAREAAENDAIEPAEPAPPTMAEMHPDVSDARPSTHDVMNNPEEYLLNRADGREILHEKLAEINDIIKELRADLRRKRPYRGRGMDHELRGKARAQVEDQVKVLVAGRKRINEALGKHGEIPDAGEVDPYAIMAQPTEYNLQDMIARPYAYRDAEMFDEMEHAVKWLDKDIETLRQLYRTRRDKEGRDAIERSIQQLITDRQKIVDAMKSGPDFIRGRPKFGVHREAIEARQERARLAQEQRLSTGAEEAFLKLADVKKGKFAKVEPRELAYTDVYTYIDRFVGAMEDVGIAAGVGSEPSRLAIMFRNAYEGMGGGDDMMFGSRALAAEFDQIAAKHFPDNGITLKMSGEDGIKMLDEDGMPLPATQNAVRNFMREASAAVIRHERARTPTAEEAQFRMPPAAREAPAIPWGKNLPVLRRGELARTDEDADFTQPGLAPSAYRGPGTGREQGQIEGPEQGLIVPRYYTSQIDETVDKPLVVHRGRYSRNLLDRLFEHISDKTLESNYRKGPVGDLLAYRQKKFLRGNYDTRQAHARRAFYMKREDLMPLVSLGEKLTSSEMTAAVQAHMQGVTPREMLRAYTRLVEFSNLALQRAAFPKELKDILKHERTPSAASLDAMERFLKDRPEWSGHLDWIRRYRRHIDNEDYIDDNLFGDIIWSSWKGNKDLENQVKLWQHIVEKEGDNISPEMQDFMNEARKQSNRVDDMLEEEGLLTRQIMDNRRYQRQNLISSILGEEFSPRTHAIYVPDKATTTKFGDYLFRRSRKTDPDQVFGPRFAQNKGRLLETGRINPSFGTYFTGLSSAVSKIDAIKLQHEVLRDLAHQIKPGQTTYDGNRFVLYNKRKGVEISQEQMRTIMDQLNKEVGVEYEAESFMNLRNQQEIARWHGTQHTPGKTLRTMTDAEKKLADAGDLYLVPRPVYERMIKPVTGSTINNVWGRNAQIATRAFRRVALGWRPAYLIINTAESFFRASYFGGVGTANAILFRNWKLSAEDRAKLIPKEVQRMAYAGNVMQRVRGGGSQWAWQDRASDAFARARRAPYFGSTIDRAAMILKYPDYILSGTARAENYMRESLIIARQLKEARKTYDRKDWHRYIGGINDNMKKAMADVAAGRDITKGDAMNEIVRDVGRVLGDFSKTENAYVQIAFPFYRWIKFITKFVLWEAPVHYPGRTFLLSQLGQMGYADLQRMGLVSPSAAGAIPLGDAEDEENKDWGTIDKVVSVLYTQAWNGMSTVAQLAGVEPATGTTNFGQGISHNLNPFMQAAFAGFTLKDPGNFRQLQGATGPLQMKDYGAHISVAVAMSLKAFWPVLLDFDYAEQADNSIPMIREVLLKNPDKALAQPQSTATERITAMLTGFRRRKINLTKLQMKNINDAQREYGVIRKALNPDPNDREDNSAQLKFDAYIEQQLEIQLRYLSEWYRRYGDPTMAGEVMPAIDEISRDAVPNSELTPAQIAARDKERGYSDADLAALP